MDTCLNLLGLTLEVLDGIAYPLHYLGHKAWKSKSKRNRVRNTITQISNREILVRSADVPRITLNEAYGTFYDMFRDIAIKNPDQDIMGHRECFEERMVVTDKGVEMLKYVLDDEYKWLTFEQVLERIDQIAKGFMAIGIGKGDHVALYANACKEWTMTFLALNKIGSTVVTIYPNLGLEGVKYAISSTACKCIVTSQENLKVIDEVLEIIPDTKVVYFENKCLQRPDLFPSTILGLDQVIRLGNGITLVTDTRPKRLVREETALIMFTSGTTGTPKGVILSHGNILAGVQVGGFHGRTYLLEKDMKKLCGIGYLPTAHITGLQLELFMLTNGVKIGYSSPYTLTDLSPRVMPGQKGDLNILKPTLMPGVGLVLERLRKGIMGKISERGPCFEKVFQFCYDYKKKWLDRGMDTPILNKVFFSKFSQAVGGKMQTMTFGASPISPDLAEFFRICVCPGFVMGWGTTETSSCGTFGDRWDEPGESGTVLPNIVLKLEDWEEGGYAVQDPSGPAGEILVSSPCVAKGYYALQDDSFFKDHHGINWFRTGDIGRLNPKTGAITIIDRKKEIIKLQMGEYVSLAKVESAVKSHKLVEAVCVYADPFATTTLAIIVPNEKALSDLAHEIKSKERNKIFSLDKLCRDQLIKQKVLAIVQSHCKRILEPFETPKGVILEPELWTPESGLVTATMKLKRKSIASKYQAAIKEAYLEIKQNHKQA